MAIDFTKLPPPPVGAEKDAYVWVDWYTKLQRQINTNTTTIEEVDTTVTALTTEGVGIPIGATNPASGTEGALFFNTTDGKLYRYHGGAWTAAVPTVDLVGQITAAQIEDAAINTAKFASGIEPVGIVSSVPGTLSTQAIFNTSDGKLYRWNGSAYVATILTTDLSGTITTTQITDDAITTAKIAANAITATELAASSVIAGKIAAAAVSTTELAANAVNASKIAANAVTSDKILANAITAGKIATDAVTADKIAANSVTSDKILANAIIAGKIAAGVIGTTELAAEAVTADKIAVGVVSDNLCYNGSPDIDNIGTAGWFSVEGGDGVFTVTSTSVSGMGSFRFDLEKPLTTDQEAYGCRPFSVVPGNTYTIRFRAGANASTATGKYIRINYDTALPTDGLLTGAVRSGFTDLVTGNSAWSATSQDYEYTWTCPAGVYAATLTIYSWTNGPTQLYLDNFEIYCTTGATLIRPGFIVTDSIVAGSITADEIAADAVTADKINVTNLAAVNTSTGTLSVNGTLTVTTSGKIQSGKTVYGSDTGWLIEYNSGTPRLDIGSTSAYMRWDGSQLLINNATTTGVANPITGTKATDVHVGASGTATAEILFATNGTVTATSGTTVNWYKPSTSGIGSSYHVRFRRIYGTGSMRYSGSSTEDTGWLALTAGRTVSVINTDALGSGASSSYSWSVLAEISNDGGTTVAGSGIFQATATRTNPS